MLYHITLLYTLADGIGQDTLKTIACGELYAAFISREQDNKTVVTSFLSNTVLLAQTIGKVEAVTTLNACEHCHKGLYARLFLKSK